MMNNTENVDNGINIFSKPEIQQQMAVLMCGKQQEKQDLTTQQKEAITQSYMEMYFALAAFNWGGGMTLGVAWQKALEQMHAFVSSKAKTVSNPVNKYLVGVHAQHRRDMSERMMFSPNAEDKLNLNKQDTMMWNAVSLKKFQNSKAVLTDIHKQFEPKVIKIDSANFKRKSEAVILFNKAKQQAKFLTAKLAQQMNQYKN